MEHHEFLREIRVNDRIYHTLRDDIDQFLYGRKFKEKKLTGSDFNKIKGYNLSEKYDISMLEKQLVYAYLKNTGIDYSKNSLLKQYLASIDMKSFEIWNSDITSFESLGNYLEILIPPEDKKLNGAFFTPSYIVDFIIKEINPQKDDKNLDPSCGCGAFLIGLVQYYCLNYGKSVRQALRENIFGADILGYNIERTEILLAILGLRYGENVEKEDFNLAVQDSLRANWTKTFLRNPQGTFNNIIGNPPYVKFQDLSEDNRKFLLNHCVTIQEGTFNLYFAFFELGNRLLSENGKLGYITPNNYFTSLAGESLRKYFQDHKCGTKIIDFNHKQVFDAQTYTAITFLNTEKNETILFDRISEGQSPELFLQHIKESPNPLKKLNAKKWRLLKSDEQENIKKIESMGTPLCQLCDIRVGIATLKDELYFIDSRSEKNGYFIKSLDSNSFEIEKEATRSIYKISDFQTQEECSLNTRRIIFPYKILNQNALPISENDIKRRYPKTYQYFLYVIDRLKNRDKGKTIIEPFYAYGRTQGLVRTGKKLITPTFSRYPRFMIAEDENALFCNGYALYLKEIREETAQSFLFGEAIKPIFHIGNIHILQKILNSYIMHYYVSKTSVSIAGGYPCYQKNFIEKFTIPNMTDEDLKIIDLSDKRETDAFLIEKYHLNLSVPKRPE